MLGRCAALALGCVAAVVAVNVVTESQLTYDPDEVTCYTCEAFGDGIDCCPEGAKSCAKTIDGLTMNYPPCNAGCKCDDANRESCWGRPMRTNLVPTPWPEKDKEIWRKQNNAGPNEEPPLPDLTLNEALEGDPHPKWSKWGGACVLKDITAGNEGHNTCYRCTAHTYKRTQDSPALCPAGTLPACVNSCACENDAAASCQATVRMLGVKGSPTEMSCVVEMGNEPHVSPSPKPDAKTYDLADSRIRPKRWGDNTDYSKFTDNLPEKDLSLGTLEDTEKVPPPALPNVIPIDAEPVQASGMMNAMQKPHFEEPGQT